MTSRTSKKSTQMTNANQCQNYKREVLQCQPQVTNSSLIVVNTSTPQIETVLPPSDERPAPDFNWYDEEDVYVQEAETSTDGYQIVTNTRVSSPQPEPLPDAQTLPKQSVEMFLARINSQLMNPSQEGISGAKNSVKKPSHKSTQKRCEKVQHQKSQKKQVHVASHTTRKANSQPSKYYTHKKCRRK